VVKRGFVPSSGPGAEGRSLGATEVERSGSSEKRESERSEKNKSRSISKMRGKCKGELVPLNAWARLLLGRGDSRGSGGSGAQAQAVWRAETFRLITTLELEEFLQRVGDTAAKLINVESYRRRQLLFEGRGIDRSWKSVGEA